jgi:uncharacterized protein (DUF1330 family)
MAAYLIVQVDVTDPEAYAEYRKQVPATLAAYDGKFLVRGGAMRRLEGDWPYERVVVIEFPSVERALAWYDSPEYRAPKAMRHGASRANIVVVEGA